MPKQKCPSAGKPFETRRVVRLVSCAFALAIGAHARGARASEPAESLTTEAVGSRTTVVGGEGKALHRAHEEHEYHFAVGAKGSYLAAIEGGEVIHRGGGGAFFEASLIHDRLELEISARGIAGHATTLSFEALAKLPIKLGKRVQLFVGLGPALAIAVAPETAVGGGGVVALGSYFWVSDHVGLLVESNYSLLYEKEVGHEVGGNGGVAYRF